MPSFSLRLLGSALAVGTLLAAPALARADALRCGGRLVSVGDTALELKARCGPPDHVDVRTVLKADGFEGPQASQVVQRNQSGQAQTILTTPTLRRVRYVREQVQTWLYAGDKQRLPRLVTVRRGQVAKVKTLSQLDVTPDRRCERAIASKGTTVGAIQLACGAPDDRASWEDETELQVGSVIQRRLVVRERWTYNPGPGRFLRILEFANGRLLKVSTGGRAP